MSTLIVTIQVGMDVGAIQDVKLDTKVPNVNFVHKVSIQPIVPKMVLLMPRMVKDQNVNVRLNYCVHLAF